MTLEDTKDLVANVPHSQTNSRYATRVAIVSTPRSGNSWVRSVLRDALSLQEIAVHNPRDIPSDLPERVVLQIHWYREPNFQHYLEANGFRRLVISRHPLDVLISAWHFAPYEPLTARWLEGNAELPSDIVNHSPASRAFVSYATSWGAENLLSISYQWWHDPAAIRFRYEDLVHDPMSGFAGIIRSLGGCPHQVPAALERNRLAVFQGTPNRHAWRALPGLWRTMITPAAALRIWWRHKQVFKTLGYGLPVSIVGRHSATRAWERLR
jgi:hypothetical protein